MAIRLYYVKYFPAFMSICLPFLLYVCGFFSKDHAYTSIEDSMAIGDPRVDNYSPQNNHQNKQ